MQILTFWEIYIFCIRFELQNVYSRDETFELDNKYIFRCLLLQHRLTVFGELYWIKELGTAAPYGCNYQIKGVGSMSSPYANVLISWVFLTNNNDKGEAMDIGIKTKSSSAKFNHRYLTSILLIQLINHKVFTKLKQHCSLFPSQSYENYDDLPKNPQT